MATTGTATLRGFDSYRVSLGDEMRGERASLGKSLLDVQRDLRIKAAHIDAIENSNPGAVPYKGFVTGYVRAYARYLGMDEDVVLRRFCEESGFDPGNGALAQNGAQKAGAPRRDYAAAGARRDDLDAVIAGSRLAAASRSASVNADLGATLRGLGSLAVLATLVGGLGYGAWSLLENIQRVDFAPLPQAPDALAAAPDLDAMTRVARAGAVPAPIIDAAALAAVYAMQEVAPPRLEARDGPISALDPASSGVYAAAPQAPAGDPASVPLDPAFAAAVEQAVDTVLAEAQAAPVAAASAAPVHTGVALVAESEAWVRVRNATGGVMHETLMQPGEVWRAPQGAEGLTLRAGNAGGVYLEIDGARFGPLGRPGGVVSNVLLDAEAVRRVFPAADAPAAAPLVTAERTALATP